MFNLCVFFLCGYVGLCPSMKHTKTSIKQTDHCHYYQQPYHYQSLNVANNTTVMGLCYNCVWEYQTTHSTSSLTVINFIHSTTTTCQIMSDNYIVKLGVYIFSSLCYLHAGRNIISIAYCIHMMITLPLFYLYSTGILYVWRVYTCQQKHRKSFSGNSQVVTRRNA